MEVIEGRFKKEEDAPLRAMLNSIAADIPEDAIGDFVLLYEINHIGEVFTSQSLAETVLMIELAKKSLLSDETGEVDGVS